MKNIKNLIENQDFLFKYPEKGEPMTPCMDFYKAKIQPDGSIEKLKLRTVVRGDLKNKELVGDTWSPTASTRTLKCFLADSFNHKSRVHQFCYIGSFLLEKVNNRVFVKLDS